MERVIFFRGRNTEAIKNDCFSKYLNKDNSEIVIICRDNDNLREQGDLTVSEFLEKPDVFQEILVANGGTTAQQIPICCHLLTKKCKLKIIEVDRDGVVSVLYNVP